MTQIPTPATPTQLRAKCAFCTDEVNIRADGVFQFVSGWMANRGAGGGNAVALPERQQRWAHSWCIDSRKSGTTQGSML